jgi:hypothetical protein
MLSDPYYLIAGGGGMALITLIVATLVLRRVIAAGDTNTIIRGNERCLEQTTQKLHEHEARPALVMERY